MCETLCRVEREIDSYGRIIIPTEFREGVGLRKGGAVLLSVQSNGSLVIENAKTLAASREKMEWGLRLLADQLGKDILVCDLYTVIAESGAAQTYHNREISPDFRRFLSESDRYGYKGGKKMCPLLDSSVPALASAAITQNGKTAGALIVMADAERSILEAPDQQELVLLDKAVKILQSQL